MQKMNDLQKQRVYHKLGELGIRYVKHEHRAVFTCEEADKYSEGIEGAHCKNLFLRNAKGKRQYLVILANGKMADLSALKKLLGEKAKLCFREKANGIHGCGKWRGICFQSYK